MTSNFDWWMSALELAGDYGKLTREQMAALGVHEDEAHDGFYMADHDDYVAIWQDGNRASVNGIPVDPIDIWTHCCRFPIDEDRFRSAEARGFTPKLTVFAK